MTPKDSYCALILGRLANDYGPGYAKIRQRVLLEDDINLVKEGLITEQDRQMLYEARRYQNSIKLQIQNGIETYDSIYDLLLIHEWALYCGGWQGETNGFRGNLNADWELSPNLFRDSSRIEDEMQKTLIGARMLLQSGSPVEHLDALKLLGVLQHYNFKTFLLDFTTDIRIAAAFACRGYRKESRISFGAIIKLSRSDFKRLVPNVATALGMRSAFTLDEVPRIRLQKGVFFNNYKIRMFEILTACTSYHFKHGPDSETFQQTVGLTEQTLFPYDDQIYRFIKTAKMSSHTSQIMELDEEKNKVFQQVCNLLKQTSQFTLSSAKISDYMHLAKSWIDWDTLSEEAKHEIRVLVRWFIKIQELHLPYDCKSFSLLQRGVKRIAAFNDQAEKTTDIFDRLKYHHRPAMAMKVEKLFGEARREVIDTEDS